MKKLFIVFGIMFLFASTVYGTELFGADRSVIQNCMQSINKSLRNNTELSGEVQIYFEIKQDKSLNTHKIISYDNELLAELFDSRLKSLEKSPENFSTPKFRCITNLIVQNGRVKAEILSRNYAPTQSNIKYYKKLIKQINQETDFIPREDSIGLDDAVFEMNISSIGKVKTIRLLQSSGDKNYDDTICNYFLEKKFEMPPADALKNGCYSIILNINPVSQTAQEEYNNYTKQISEEIEKQIGYFTDKPVYFQFDTAGAAINAQIYNGYNLIKLPILEEELKKIRVSPYQGQYTGNNINVLYTNKSSIRNVVNYYSKKMAPVLVETLPEINTLSLKPVRCLIFMNKNGNVEEVAITQSSGSLQIDNDTVNAIKYNSYEPYTKSQTEKFVFEIEVYNLNKYLRQYYAKYAKTVASYTLGNVPNIGLHYMRTAKILFTITKDGKIKQYTLYNASGNAIKEKIVEDGLKKLTFPEFPPTIDADELDVLVDLYDPGNNAMTNIILNATSIGADVLYLILRNSL